MYCYLYPGTTPPCVALDTYCHELENAASQNALFPCSQFSTKVLLPAGAMDAAVAAATDSHRQQLHTIKAAALANLAWLSLQQQNWQQAQQTCEAWLQVSHAPNAYALLMHIASLHMASVALYVWDIQHVG